MMQGRRGQSFSSPPEEVGFGGWVILGGLSVKVCPSVVSVVGLVTAGKDIVSLPITVLLELRDVDDGGRKVNVWPSVVRVVAPVTETVFVPITITLELDIIVCPSVPVNVDGFSVETDARVVDGGENVKVWPSVVNVVGLDGAENVFVPIMITPELDMIVCPSVPISVDGFSWLWLEDVGGSRVIVCPLVVRVVAELTGGSAMVSEPITVNEVS